jgi:thymidylate synthase (FAD)
MQELLEHYQQDCSNIFYRQGIEVIMPSVSIIYDNAEDREMETYKKLEKIIRIAYKSEDKTTNDSYLKMLDLVMTNKHLSTLEHVDITFKFVTNRGVTHELVRHRIASYTQESTRYVNYNKKPAQIIYPAWLYTKTIDQKLAWYNINYDTLMYYKRLIDLGFKPQEARGVLPNDLKTEIYCTMNLRELIHFFELRTATGAHPDMQVVAKELQRIMKINLPVIFDR